MGQLAFLRDAARPFLERLFQSTLLLVGPASPRAAPGGDLHAWTVSREQDQILAQLHVACFDAVQQLQGSGRVVIDTLA